MSCDLTGVFHCGKLFAGHGLALDRLTRFKSLESLENVRLTMYDKCAKIVDACLSSANTKGLAEYSESFEISQCIPIVLAEMRLAKVLNFNALSN